MDKVSVQNLVKGYSIETTIREASRVEKFSDLVPPGTHLYIVYVAGADLRDTATLAARLRKEGLEPVPHIVARHISSLSVLEDFLRRLSGDAGAKQALVIGGDTAQPKGELDSSLRILDSGLLEKYGVTNIGVAGYPEGHRVISDD